MSDYLVTEWTALADQLDGIAETYEQHAQAMRERAARAREQAEANR